MLSADILAEGVKGVPVALPLTPGGGTKDKKRHILISDHTINGLTT